MQRRLGQQFKAFLAANYSFRRVIAIIFGLACVGVCVGAAVGMINLPIWQSLIVLVLGLLFFEWAG